MPTKEDGIINFLDSFSLLMQKVMTVKNWWRIMVKAIDEKKVKDLGNEYRWNYHDANDFFFQIRLFKPHRTGDTYSNIVSVSVTNSDWVPKSRN